MLRKRRKAEKRELDMQRRQKERIEEVRESQKKVAIIFLICTETISSANYPSLYLLEIPSPFNYARPFECLL